MRDNFLSETIRKDHHGQNFLKMSMNKSQSRSIYSDKFRLRLGWLEKLANNDRVLTSKLFEIQNKTQELANKREQKFKDKATQNLQAPRRIETKEQIDELVKKLEALREPPRKR